MEKISVKWNVNQASVKRLTDGYVKKNLANINNNLTDFSDKAAEFIVKESILKGSSTGTMWHRMANKNRGNEFGARYETGQMASNVGFLPSEMVGEGEMASEFGLFTGGEDYFMRQEFGFDLQLKNGIRKVKGMFSAQKAMKLTRPLFRKKMLSTGFLVGKTDARGQRVLSLMGGVNRFGESVGAQEFDVAWRATSPGRTDAQIKAYREMQNRAAQMQTIQALNDAKWANNRRVIDALEFGRKYAQAEYNAQRKRDN